MAKTTDVWGKRMYKILCGDCKDLYMAESDTAPHKNCPSVPHEVEPAPAVRVSAPVVKESEPKKEEESTNEDSFMFGVD